MTKLAVLEATAKAMPLRAVDHGGVDADDFAGRRHQRSAGIAGVERGIGLNDVVDQPAGRGAHRAAERRDDAGGDGPFEAERIADGDRDLAAPEALGIAERGDVGKAAVGAHQRDVGVGVAAKHAPLARSAIRHRDPNVAGVADDVEIGDDQPVLSDHEARAMAAGTNALDAADGRSDSIDGVGDRRRVGVEQGVIGLEFFGGEGHGWAPV